MGRGWGRRSGGDLDAAREMDGLSEEIAVLRVRLAELLGGDELDQRVFMDAVSVLIRAVATEYRLSPKAREDLASNFRGGAEQYRRPGAFA